MASVEPAAGKRPHVKTEKMQEYMRSHGDGSSQKILRCPIEGCGKQLTSAPGLRYHIKSHSGPERPFLCQRCQKTFKSANGLKYHQEKTKCDGSVQGVSIQSQTPETDISDIYTEDNTSHHSYKLPNYNTDLTSLESPQKPLTIPCQSCEGEEPSGQVDRLTELAIIATSPQSPLMQKSLPVKMDQARGSVVRSLEKSLHSQTRLSDSSPPWSTSSFDFSPPLPLHVSAPSSVESLEPEDTGCETDSEAVVTSSSPFPACPENTEAQGATWSHSWPTAVWQCFIKDCKIRFLSGSRSDEWQNVQDLADRDNLTATATCLSSELLTIRYAENGLRLLQILQEEEVNSTVQLKFSPEITDQPDILVLCATDHPFFVKNKGWSSLDPSSTAEHYGIPCRELKVDDICLSPSHPDATFTEDVFKSFKSHDFTPMDTSAVFALSNMKKQRLDQELSPKHTPESPPGKRSPTKCTSEGEYKRKRPMNSFLLFAKKSRLELTQQFPGRDNRAISVILGDRWHKMTMEERDIYAQQARLLAEEQKKIHPDCWKRKRSTPDPP